MTPVDDVLNMYLRRAALIGHKHGITEPGGAFGTDEVIMSLDAAGYTIADSRIPQFLDRLFHLAPIINERVIIEDQALETFIMLSDILYGRAMISEIDTQEPAPG